MKKSTAIVLGLAALFSLGVSCVNIHAKEAQPPVVTILVCAFLLSCLAPKLAWLWALILGGSVLSYSLAPVLGYPVPYPPEPNILASFLAFVPAFLGTYAGVLARWFVFSTASQQS